MLALASTCVESVPTARLALVEHSREYLMEHLLGHALAGLAQGALIGRALLQRVAEEAPQGE